MTDSRDPSAPYPLRVVVASPLSTAGDGIEDAVRHDFESRRCHTAQELLALVSDQDVDVAIVDQHLVDAARIDLIGSIRAHRNAPAILTIATGDGADERVRSLESGAADCLPSRFDGAELRARVRALRRRWVDDGVDLRIGGWTLNPATRSIHSPYHGRIPLSERETSLLTVLAREPDRVFSREELIRRAFPRSSLPGAIDTYVHYLRGKTERGIIRTVHGIGYRLGEMP